MGDYCLNMRNILIFDYSHGVRKYTPGKRSPDERLIEGEWSREIGPRILKSMEELGFECYAIVTEDEDISLRKRVERANRIALDNPDAQCYYISLHVNAAPGGGWSNASGWTVYVSTNASDESKQLAKTMYGVAKEFGLQGNRRVPAEEYWTANFFVIKNTRMPAILTENLFMTNKDEVDFLLSEEGKQTIVNLHIAAICKYFGIPIGVCVA